MKNIDDKEYAEYMLANYILGYVDTSIFIGANLFDKYFQTEVSSKKINSIKAQKKKNHLDLWVYIDLYINSDKIRQDVLYDQTNDLKTKLGNFRDLRNMFIHKMNDKLIIQRNKEIGEFILYVYYSFHKDLDYDSTIIHDESTKNTLTQDYKIKEITERMNARMEKEKFTDHSSVKTFKGINKKDFDNLFELRKKLRYLQRIIEKEMLEVGLETTILSPIDTTSAYIWMPFPDRDFTDNVNKFRTKRNNLVVGSTSILATPIDFRIYIDFGGGDYEYRLAFQNFLQSNQFAEYIQKFRNHEPSLKIFDVKWYSFIVQENNLLDIINDKSLTDMVVKAITIIKDEQDKDNIVTAGYNHVGFILPAQDIDKIEILSLFKKMAHLYYEFLIYKFKDDPDVDSLKVAQNILMGS